MPCIGTLWAPSLGLLPPSTSYLVPREATQRPQDRESIPYPIAPFSLKRFMISPLFQKPTDLLD